MAVLRSGFLPVTICVIVVSCFLQSVVSQLPDRSRIEQYPFNEDLEEDRFILRWGFNDTHIMFEVQVRTLGWVGFGISDTGRMVTADVVIGYIANGQVHFGDFHTLGYTMPQRDTTQNWFATYGYEENGWTVLGFERLLDTCDLDDRAITKHSSRLIFAYHESDPQGGLFENLGRIKHTKKGMKSVALLTRPTPPVYLPADSNYMDFLNANFTIPSNQQTTFRCRAFDLSDVTTKYHIIKMEPIFTESMNYNVDHMTLYRCRTRSPQAMIRSGESFDCITDAPGHLQFCREHVASFGHGKTEFYLPQDIGIPIGGGGDEPNMYILATQYEVLEPAENMVDDSGIRITYTPELRQHEAGFLSLGSLISPNWVQFIPPGEQNFEQRAYCSMKCLAWGNEGGCSPTSRNPIMTVAGVQFHSHSLGRTMKLRHLTYVQHNVSRENPYLSYDNAYDPDQQTFRVTSDRRTISCWDELLLECGYDSTQRFRPTVGGWTEHDELCRGYVLYYPRKRLEGCMSWNKYNAFKDTRGNRIPGERVFPFLASTNWDNAEGVQMRRNLKESLKTSKEYGQCWSSRRSPKYAIDEFAQPEITNEYTEQIPSPCF